jgi:hypothetical protein
MLIKKLTNVRAQLSNHRDQADACHSERTYLRGNPDHWISWLYFISASIALITTCTIALATGKIQSKT